MDLARYRTAAPQVCRWPTGGLVAIRPLPRTQITNAIDLVKRLYAAIGGGPGEASDQRVAAEILSRALRRADRPEKKIGSPQDILDALTPKQLIALSEQWLAVQREATPDGAQLEAEVELQAYENDATVKNDVVLCGMYESPSEFYSQRLDTLTDGQIAYFLACKTVHNRLYIEKDTKCRSLKLLRQKAGRSENSNQQGAISSKSNGRERMRKSA